MEKEHLPWASTLRGTRFLPSFRLDFLGSSAAHLQNIPVWGSGIGQDFVTAPPDAMQPSSAVINEMSELSLSTVMSL